MSHFHNLEDGFANLEAASEWIEDDRSSSLSVVRKSVVQKPKESIERTFSEAVSYILLQVTVNAYVHSGHPTNSTSS